MPPRRDEDRLRRLRSAIDEAIEIADELELAAVAAVLASVLERTPLPRR